MSGERRSQDPGPPPDLDPDLESRLARGNLMESLRPVSGEPHRETTRLPPPEQPPASAAPSADSEAWDPWKVVLPDQMGNWQQLTLLPSPGNPQGIIGEGGQAIVYSYVQRELGREVAVKTLRRGRRSLHDVENLVREACVTARLQHPNIVPVHYLHLPEHADDVPYWVMKRIMGRPLTAHLPGGEFPWPFPRLLEAFRSVLNAVAFAHSRGIVHRDLKPDNILVGEFGEVQVTDWGLALAIAPEAQTGPQPILNVSAAAALAPSEEESLPPGMAALNQRVRSGTVGAPSREAAGGRAGTPSFMAPEQLDMTAEVIDERTDVFQLGGVLYAILTGRPPHDLSERTGSSTALVRERYEAIAECTTIRDPAEQRMVAGMPAAPEGLSEAAMPLLSAVVMKALAPDPRGRYPEVGTFADALDRWEAQAASAELCGQADARLAAAQSGKRNPARDYAEAIALSSASLEKLQSNDRAARIRDEASAALTALHRRSVRRLALSVAAVALVGVVGLLGYQRTSIQRKRAESQQLEAERARREADKERDKALREAYYANLALAERKLEDGARDEAGKILDRCAVQVRAWEWGRMRRLCRGGDGVRRIASDPVSSVAFSPDGKRLACALRNRTLRVINAESGLEVLTLKGRVGAVSSVAFSPCAKRLASGGEDGRVMVWSVETGRVELDLGTHGAGRASVAFSPDGKRLASAGGDGILRLWQTDNGRQLLQLESDGGGVTSVAFGPNGKRLASTNRAGRVTTWDAETGGGVLTLGGKATLMFEVVIFSPDGRRIAASNRAGAIEVWEARDGRGVLTVSGYGSALDAIAFSPAGKRIASGGRDGIVRLWDASSGREMLRLRDHGGPVNAVAFSPDGCRLVAAGAKGVTVWLAEDAGVKDKPGE